MKTRLSLTKGLKVGDPWYVQRRIFKGLSRHNVVNNGKREESEKHEFFTNMCPPPFPFQGVVTNVIVEGMIQYFREYLGLEKCCRR